MSDVVVSMNELTYSLDEYGEKILEWADPGKHIRGYTEDWPLTRFSTAVYIAVGYFAFVVLGSAMMHYMNMKPIDPYPLKFIYNVSQIMLCSYMTIEALLLAYRNDYTVLPCEPYNNTNPPLANLLWLFYVSKVWDFCDTFFIVIGKKYRQLSFLHVYHHITIFLFYWLNSHVNYDGDIYLTILLNGFIHTVMYTYYFISMHTKIPETGKSIRIWWKSSLTALQMIQFITMMSQGTYLIATQCNQVSLKVVATYVVYILSLFILFAQFFVQSYIKPSSAKSSSSNSKSGKKSSASTTTTTTKKMN